MVRAYAFVRSYHGYTFGIPMMVMVVRCLCVLAKDVCVGSVVVAPVQ